MSRGRGYYDSPGWAELKAACKRRDDYRCRRCGWRARSRWDRSRLHAHHVVERDRGGADQLSNLICLCADCHSLSHPKNGGLRSRAGGAPPLGPKPFSARHARMAMAPKLPRAATPNLFRAKSPRPPARFR